MLCVLAGRKIKMELISMKSELYAIVNLKSVASVEIRDLSI